VIRPDTVTREPSARQISQVAGTPLLKAMACDTDGASAFSRIAKHAIQSHSALVAGVRFITADYNPSRNGYAL
jgi:hypothetical protein